MAKTTSIYKLENYGMGDKWSAGSEQRRFITVDVNLSSYIGITGLGILDGWDVDLTDGLQIQINPGYGIIDGYLMETPYIVKTRSQLTDGEREMNTINDRVTVYTSLTTSQRAEYIRVVRLYDPSFNPQGDILNANIKVSVPYIATLPDNSDCVVCIKRNFSSTPYPLLTDFPPNIGNLPTRDMYSSGPDFSQAVQQYSIGKQALNNYKWYVSDNNHFTTTIDYVITSNYVKSNDKLLVGKFKTRNGTVQKADYSDVVTLKNLETLIKTRGNELLKQHIHGGNKSFDPPLIRLETDIRECVVTAYDPAEKMTFFLIPEKDETSISLGHRHTYQIDDNGNGYTLGIEGEVDSHFHTIDAFSVYSPTDADTSNAHIHTVLTKEQKDDILNSSPSYAIKLNGVVIAQNDIPNGEVTVDLLTRSIVLENLSLASNKYRSVILSDNKKLDFETTAITPYDYMLKLIIASGEMFGDNAKNPFYGFNSDNLFNQCIVAEAIFQEVGDIFTFIPNAAQNVNVVMTEKNNLNVLECEILENVEVQGILPVDNIAYVRGDKLAYGEIDIVFLPFISHIGRYLENFNPIEHPLFSNDGARYSVSPLKTTVTLGHSHNVVMKLGGNGYTDSMVVDLVPAWYGLDKNGKYYFINHAHKVINGTLQNVSQDNLLTWQNTLNISTSPLTSSFHSHDLIYPVKGNSKVVYSIKEDSLGNIYMGTSDGLMISTIAPAYLFVINEFSVNVSNYSLYDALLDAKASYEKETNKVLVVTEDIYMDQISSAEGSLQTVGGEAFLFGTIDPSKTQDIIMVRRVAFYRVVDFGYVKEKPQSDVLPSENVISINVNSVVVERAFHDTPIKSMVIAEPNVSAYVINRNILAVGSNLIARQVSENALWNSIDIPLNASNLRKIIKTANGEYWINSNNGFIVSRVWDGGTFFSTIKMNGLNNNIRDFVECSPNHICCVTIDGIFKTVDGGKSWSQQVLLDIGFNTIVRDLTLDKSNVVNGHYHIVSVDSNGDGFLEESIGSGVFHVHQMTSWTVAESLGHSHTIVTVLYASDNSMHLWKSQDSGVTWIQNGSMPEGENGTMFASFNKLYVAKQDALYCSSDMVEWTSVFEQKVYSYGWNYRRTALFVGTDNSVYQTIDGTSFTLNLNFGGSAFPVLNNNGSRTYFGYAYNNNSRVFHFNDTPIADNNLTGIVDFNQWYADNGKWATDILYDIYINYIKTLSTKSDYDVRSKYGYNFSVVPSEGKVNFGMLTTLSANANVYTNTISVKDSSGFYVGDEIAIITNILSDLTLAIVQSYYYASIASIDGNVITLDSSLTKNITASNSTIERLSSLDGGTSIIGTIYESLLTNIGKFTHEELEDKLSIKNTSLPFEMSNVFLSDLLLLTQAVRYAYPDISALYKNHQYYNFRYSYSGSSILPNVSGFVDIPTSAVESDSIFNMNFVKNESDVINKIMVGSGAFDSTVIVATNIGMFWSRMENNFEANWFCVNQLNFPVYDIIIIGDSIFAMTDSGVYSSQDMENWTLNLQDASKFPIYTTSLRWRGDYVEVPEHRAFFNINGGDEGNGYILADEGIPYIKLTPNRIIAISNVGSGNGNYIIKSVGDAGQGYGSRLDFTTPLSGSGGIKSDVKITMATWWQKIDDTSKFQTQIVAGNNSIAYKDVTGNWVPSVISDTAQITDFAANKLCTLSNGQMLMSSTGIKDNYLLNTLNVGNEWSLLHRFYRVSGTILSNSISDADNTTVSVVFSDPLAFKMIKGIFENNDIVIYNNGVSVFQGKVVWNKIQNSENLIIIKGNTASSFATTNSTFEILPMKVNSMVEISKPTTGGDGSIGRDVLFGTSKGMFTDSGSLIRSSTPNGQILKVGIKASVTKIDMSGKILITQYDNATNHTSINVTLDTIVGFGELVGSTLYITDLEAVEAFPIMGNSSMSSINEINILVDGSIPIEYIGKRFTIVGDNSKVSVAYDTGIVNGQFNGGSIYISSNEFGNAGTSYGIKKSTISYIELTAGIIPSSTFITSSSLSSSLRVGQEITFVSSDEKLLLYSSFDRFIKQNEFNGFVLEIYDSPIAAMIGMVFEITDNGNNTMRIDPGTQSIPLLIGSLGGSKFRIEGFVLDSVFSFNCQQASKDLDHYHDLNMVGSNVSGKLSSFISYDTSFVTITVSDTVNFNTSIVQLRSDLFKGATIVFTNKDNFMQLETEVVSHNATSITVKLKSSTLWSFVSFSDSKISVGWSWFIEASNYGYTNNVFYDNFVVNSKKITQNLNRGSTQVLLENVTGLVVGNRIKIVDSTHSEQFVTIVSIPNASSIVISSASNRTFFLSKNPQIKVLSDSFSNIHVHQIRDNEIIPVEVSDYNNLGYPQTHSHCVSPLIFNVLDISNTNRGIIVIGNDSIVYNSNDYGNTWVNVGDMNDYIETSDTIGELSAIESTSDGHVLIAGRNGYVFVNDVDPTDIVKICYPWSRVF